MDTLNKALSVHAVQMLTTCYFPGVIAAYIQLFRGTKYSRFPNWLDKWLKMRKQLGLLMLFSACLHVSAIHMYKYYWYRANQVFFSRRASHSPSFRPTTTTLCTESTKRF